MGFLSGVFSAVVKTALTPVCVLKDAVNIITDQEVDATASILESAADDISNAADDLGDGAIL